MAASLERGLQVENPARLKKCGFSTALGLHANAPINNSFQGVTSKQSPIDAISGSNTTQAHALQHMIRIRIF
ncbi:hypothetical protein J0X15_03540 [Roseibium sp. CAU 1637]|uniref:Uncharacterized protein n=1 Tax=Roseibium limicola TaxID=2816037 RepID=A0A939J7J0_9HYPH|nr:hypothetical protein [Roseibium limicola]MBO0344286.1 hypothetical protein [Roseibium limicola]